MVEGTVSAIIENIITPARISQRFSVLQKYVFAGQR
jgi:hypothetical protein